jgi:precorrin-6Y C5,15-methyltransferase (decarboxylating)
MTAWISVVGIGEDGVDGLGSAQREAIAQASHVFGGARHLELARPVIAGEAHAWPSPFSVEPVLKLRGKNVCVLASGDPFLFGVGATLARQVAASEMRVFPAPSAFSLAAAAMGWALQEVSAVSLHGRPIDLIRPHLHSGHRILALTSDGDAPAVIAQLISAFGFGRSRVTVLEALGGPHQRIRTTTAAEFDLTQVNALNVLAIKVESDSQARILPFTPGRPNALFENDGQLTTREVRAITLSSLAPRHGELLWDVGAGSGSIAIEWMLADPSLRAVAVEADAVRAERIRANANANGVPGLVVVQGAAPAALTDLDTPDAIFIGGGGSEEGVLQTAIDALRSGGRLVANAVTLEFEQMLLAAQATLGGELLRIAISHATPVGSMQGWKPAMPVTQWVWTKP